MPEITTDPNTVTHWSDETQVGDYIAAVNAEIAGAETDPLLRYQKIKPESYPFVLFVISKEDYDGWGALTDEQKQQKYLDWLASIENS